MSKPTGTVVHDLSITDYHAMRRLSKSKASILLDKTPAHLEAKVWTATRAKRIGTAVHALLLEPERAAKLLDEKPKPKPQPDKPDLNFRLAVNKEAHKEWKAACEAVKAENAQALANWEESRDPAATAMQGDELEVAKAAAHAVQTHPGVIRAGILNGRTEQSILFDIDGCPAMCRLDLVCDRGIVYDIKTCRDASAFERVDVPKYRYHLQDALYTYGAAQARLDPKDFIFVVIEVSDEMLNALPEDRWRFVRFVQLDSTARAQGEREMFRAAKVYKECLEAGEWPGFNQENAIDPASLPMWAIDIED